MFLDLMAKFQKLKKKTQNSRKKLKLWEDFAPPERPSGVIKKPVLVLKIYVHLTKATGTAGQ